MRLAYLTAILALSAAPVTGQVRCGDHDEVFAFAATQLDQYPAVRLLDTRGMEFVVITSEDGAWTIIRTDGQVACVMATGTGVMPAGMRM